MSIQNELNKLSKAKTLIRKVLEQKGTDISLSTNFTDYYMYIRDIGITNLNDLKNYLEDRLSYLEITVDKIRPYAFRYFTCLKGLYLNNSKIVSLDNINAFYEINPIIYVPSSLYNDYLTAPNWNLISDRIQIYSPQEIHETLLLEYQDYVQMVEWLSEITIEELISDYR